MHGHLNVNLSRCTVTWTSIYHDARSPERQFIKMHCHLNFNIFLVFKMWAVRKLIIQIWQDLENGIEKESH